MTGDILRTLADKAEADPLLHELRDLRRLFTPDAARLLADMADALENLDIWLGDQPDPETRAAQKVTAPLLVRWGALGEDGVTGE